MALAKVQIEKATPFQGRDEVWSNVYTYDFPTLDQALLEQVVDALVVAEKNVHGNMIAFKTAKVWDVGVPPNYMRFSKNLSGNGTFTGSPIYRECAARISWPLPRRFGTFRSIRRDLSKWLHTGVLVFNGDVAGTSPGSGFTQASAQMQYISIAREPVGNVHLCAPNGDRPTGPGNIIGYLEHRQFPRGRKEAT